MKKLEKNVTVIGKVPMIRNEDERLWFNVLYGNIAVNENIPDQKIENLPEKVYFKLLVKFLNSEEGQEYEVPDDLPASEKQKINRPSDLNEEKATRTVEKTKEATEISKELSAKLETSAPDENDDVQKLQEIIEKSSGSDGKQNTVEEELEKTQSIPIIEAQQANDAVEIPKTNNAVKQEDIEQEAEEDEPEQFESIASRLARKKQEKEKKKREKTEAQRIVKEDKENKKKLKEKRKLQRELEEAKQMFGVNDEPVTNDDANKIISIKDDKKHDTYALKFSIMTGITVASLLTAVFAFLCLYGKIPGMNPAVKDIQRKVVQVSSDVKAGDVITKDNIKEVNITDEQYDEMSGKTVFEANGEKTTDAVVLYSNANDVIGKYATDNLSSGDYLMLSDYSDIKEDEKYITMNIDGKETTIPINVTTAGNSSVNLYAIVTTTLEDGTTKNLAVNMGTFSLEGRNLKDILDSDGKSVLGNILDGSEKTDATASSESGDQ